MLIYIFISILISTLLFYSFNRKIRQYSFGKKTKNSYNILIIGGTHGNEPSSFLSLLKLVKYLNNKKINNNFFITIIPILNKSGFYTNNRYNNHFLENIDINRMYNRNFYINNYIEKIISQYNLIIDNHEGYDYHFIDKSSIGSSILPVNFNKKLISKILRNLNKDIPNNKKFMINTRKSYPKGCLREYVDKLNKEYLLIETTGITNKEPLSRRQYKTLYIILSILLYKNVITL